MILLALAACSNGPIQVPGPTGPIGKLPDPKPAPPMTPQDECAVRDHCTLPQKDKEMICHSEQFKKGADYKGEQISDAEFNGKSCIIIKEWYWAP